MSGKLISSDDAVDADEQHTAPCSDCPWRRDALNGWLGGVEPEEWVARAHGECVVGCHTKIGPECAGLAIYRANVAKATRVPTLRLPADRVTVFASPVEFIEHHTKPLEIPE